MITFEIHPQGPDHAHLLDDLLDRTFGPDRHDKTVYRLREGVEDLKDLAFVALAPEGELLASLRFWPIHIQGAPAILLGPLAVEPGLQGGGIGKSLVHHGLTEARRLNHRICVVVGAPGYYGPYGFVSAVASGLVLPGPVDPRRFQALELEPGALEGVRGTIGRVEPAPDLGAERA